MNFMFYEFKPFAGFEGKSGRDGVSKSNLQWQSYKKFGLV